MSAAETAGGLTEASRHALLPPQPVALGADPLAEIAANCSPATFLWAAALLDRLEPVDQRGLRDDAIRRGVRLCWCGSISGSSKEFASRCQAYASETYAADEAQGGPPDDHSASRLVMWDVLRFNGGDALSWRQILTIAER
jgi:hypothetical protein